MCRRGPSYIVTENPQADNLLRQPASVICIVLRADRQQDEQPLANLAGDAPSDANGRAIDPLNDGEHI